MMAWRRARGRRCVCACVERDRQRTSALSCSPLVGKGGGARFRRSHRAISKANPPARSSSHQTQAATHTYALSLCLTTSKHSACPLLSALSRRKTLARSHSKNHHSPSFPLRLKRLSPRGLTTGPFPALPAPLPARPGAGLRACGPHAAFRRRPRASSRPQKTSEEGQNANSTPKTSSLFRGTGEALPQSLSLSARAPAPRLLIPRSHRCCGCEVEEVE
jgi:hypothetical protein